MKIEKLTEIKWWLLFVLNLRLSTKWHRAPPALPWEHWFWTFLGSGRWSPQWNRRLTEVFLSATHQGGNRNVPFSEVLNPPPPLLLRNQLQWLSVRTGMSKCSLLKWLEHTVTCWKCSMCLVNSSSIDHFLFIKKETNGRGPPFLSLLLYHLPYSGARNTDGQDSSYQNADSKTELLFPICPRTQPSYSSQSLKKKLLIKYFYVFYKILL